MSFEALRQSFQPMAFHLGEVPRPEPADPHFPLGPLAAAAHQLARPRGEPMGRTPDEIPNPEVPRLGRNHRGLARTGALCENKY